MIRYQIARCFKYAISEEDELLPDIANNFVGDDLQHVESNGLAQRSALSNDDDITLLDRESW